MLSPRPLVCPVGAVRCGAVMCVGGGSGSGSGSGYVLQWEGAVTAGGSGARSQRPVPVGRGDAGLDGGAVEALLCTLAIQVR